MNSLLRAALVATVALTVLPRCSTVFPARDDQDTKSGGTSNGPPPVEQPDVPPPLKPTGAACAYDGDCESNRCATIQTTVGAQGICTRDCQTNEDCQDGSRCTQAPEGKLCAVRCNTMYDCNGYGSSLLCVKTPSTESVCWYPGATSGEVVTEPRPTIDRVKVVSGTNGLPWVIPGATVTLALSLRNDGSAGIVGGTATLVKKTSYITGLAGESAQIQLQPGEVQPILSPTFTVQASTPYGEPLPMELHVVDGTQKEWTLKFELRSFRSAATLWITRAELLVNGMSVPSVGVGQTATVTLIAENLGFGAAPNAIANVTVSDPSVTWAPNAVQPVQFSDPATLGGTTESHPIAGGLLTVGPSHTPGTPVVLSVAMTDGAGGKWTQDVSVPVQ